MRKQLHRLESVTWPTQAGEFAETPTLPLSLLELVVVVTKQKYLTLSTSELDGFDQPPNSSPFAHHVKTVPLDRDIREIDRITGESTAAPSMIASSITSRPTPELSTS